MQKIKGGYTIWARKTLESEIFLYKPAMWFKIWFFIVNRVNWQENNGFKRGSGLITYEEITLKTKATRGQVHKCLRWLEKENMLEHEQTTRGAIRFVVNYAHFQDTGNYTDNTAEHEGTTSRNTKGQQAGTRRDTADRVIRKNEKEINPPTPQGVATKIEFPMRGDFKDFDDWYPNCFLNMEGMSINRKTEEVVGAYYYLKYITCHPEREMRKRLIEGSFKEKDRDEKWRKVRSKWIEIAKLDMLNDFTSDAFEWMRESGEVIKNPLAYLREVKNNDKGYEV